MPLGSVKTSSQAADKVNFSAKRRSAHFAKSYGAVGLSPQWFRLRGCPPLLIPRKFAKDPAPFPTGQGCRDFYPPTPQ